MPQAPAPFPAVFARFAELLDERLSHGGKMLSEDTVRYTFFAALLDVSQYVHTDIWLEAPFPRHQRLQLDTLLLERGTLARACFEFKYDRKRHESQNKTQLAGKLLRDLGRLAFAHAEWKCFSAFVYLTDPGMDTYLVRPRNRLHDLFDLPCGGSLPLPPEFFLKDRPASLLAQYKEFAGYPCTAECLARESLSNNHALRIIRIEHTPDPVYDWE